MANNQSINFFLSFIDQLTEGYSDISLNDFVYAESFFETMDSQMFESIVADIVQTIKYLSDPNTVETLCFYWVARLKHYIYSQNQFINLGKVYTQLLKSSCYTFFKEFRGMLKRTDMSQPLPINILNLLKQHHRRVQTILSHYFEANFTNDLQPNPLPRDVPNDEYSANFQLRLLNIDTSDLKEPILDIGCGSGNLVLHLNELGFKTFGLDRIAPEGAQFFPDDWFDFDYAKTSWGTIIAHQSLSTHFIFNHSSSQINAGLYAKLFLKILSNLTIGGSFYYAPGLPFFEDHLEPMEQYAISKYPIKDDKIKMIQEVAYTTKILKLK